MIKSLEITNFQSHAESKLNFSKGVNIIIGSSDAGKTAIIRALRKLIWNKPSGDAIRSTWGGETRVRVETEEGAVVWSKDKVDKYTLNTTSQGKDTVREGLEFKAFGTSVPEEISRFLNINEVNLQSQLDSPFLLSETPGKVAEHWNSIAHLEVIDKATSNINSAIRELTSDIKYSEGQEILLTGNLEKYQHLPTFETEVTALEELDKENIKLCSDHDKLGKLLETYQKNKDAVLSYKNILELEKPVNDILADIKLRDEKDLQAEKLNKLIIQIKEVQSNLINQNSVLLVEKPVNDLLELYKEKETFVEQHKNLRKALLSLDGVKIQLDQAKAEFTRLHNLFEKEMPEICPLCNQKIEK